MSTRNHPEAETGTNVFSLSFWREQKIHRPSLKSYQGYLRLLTSGQLLLEAKILIEEIRNRAIGQFELSKGEILMQEMGQRFATESLVLRNQVEKMTRELRERINHNY